MLVITAFLSVDGLAEAQLSGNDPHLHRQGFLWTASSGWIAWSSESHTAAITTTVTALPAGTVAASKTATPNARGVAKAKFSLSSASEYRICAHQHAAGGYAAATLCKTYYFSQGYQYSDSSTTLLLGLVGSQGIYAGWPVERSSNACHFSAATRALTVFPLNSGSFTYSATVANSYGGTDRVSISGALEGTNIVGTATIRGAHCSGSKLSYDAAALVGLLPYW